MKNTIRVLSLWKIKSTALRRSVIVVTFPALVLINAAIAVIGLFVFGWLNQCELFRSAAHYWMTDNRIVDKDGL